MSLDSNDIIIKNENEESLPFKYSITSYGADYDVEGLVKRIEREDVVIPKFQRRFIWNISQASKFIESLLLGLPVPGIFLSRENDQKLFVIDGQQRLRTLQYFYRGTFAETGKEFSLTGIMSRFEGVKYRTLIPEDKRRLDDAIIHATVIRQDEPDDGNSSIFFIFERLNSGGVQLQPQEIRSALYYGTFCQALDKLNENTSWRKLYGGISPRKRDVELILRFFAFYYEADSYQKPIKEFLNKFMGRNRDLQVRPIEQFEKVFDETIEAIFNAVGSKAFKPKRALNAAVFDSFMVAVARRLDRGKITDFKVMKDRFQTLLTNQDYIKVTETATSDEENVRKRIQIATKIFEDIP